MECRGARRLAAVGVDSAVCAGRPPARFSAVPTCRKAATARRVNAINTTPSVARRVVPPFLRTFVSLWAVHCCRVTLD